VLILKHEAFMLECRKRAGFKEEKHEALI